jgi:hypothetical protein
MRTRSSQLWIWLAGRCSSHVRAASPRCRGKLRVVVEPHAGIRLPVVLDDGRGLTEALGEGRRADLPAEHTGPRGLWRRGAVFVAVVAPTPSRVVAHRYSRVRLARAPGVDDVAGVAVQRPACVKEPFLGRRASLVGGSPRRSSCVDRGFTPGAAPSSRASPCWRMRDAELSACWTAACSMRVCTSRCRSRALGVEGAGMARSSVAATMSFWLARGGASVLSTLGSALMRSRTCLPSSRARSPRAEASPAIEARSSRTV